MAEDLSELSLADLRDHARDVGLKGFSTMKRGELIDALQPTEADPTIKPEIEYHETPAASTPDRTGAPQSAGPPLGSPESAVVQNILREIDTVQGNLSEMSTRLAQLRQQIEGGSDERRT